MKSVKRPQNKQTLPGKGGQEVPRAQRKEEMVISLSLKKRRKWYFSGVYTYSKIWVYTQKIRTASSRQPDVPAWRERRPRHRRGAAPHDAHVVGPRCSTCMPLLAYLGHGPRSERQQAGPPAAVPRGAPVVLASRSFLSFTGGACAA